MGEDRRRAAAFARFSAAVELPLLLFALALVPLLVVPIVWDGMPPGLRHAVEVANYAIWFVFLVEYVVKLALAPDRRRFVRTHVPDLLLVLVPVLRPLRVARSARALRLLRGARVVAAAGKVGRSSRGSLPARASAYAVALATLVVVVAGAVVYDLERDADGSNIRSFGDALWWAFVTVTTVGYGDRFPVTTAGRIVGAGLMVTGIALLGVITASVAASFVRQGRADDDDVAARLARIEAAIAALGAPPPAERREAGDGGETGSRLPGRADGPRV